MEKMRFLGIGDWGLGIGDWGLGPIPNPQSPIPNPQSPIFFSKYIIFLLIQIFLIEKYYKIMNILKIIVTN